MQQQSLFPGCSRIAMAGGFFLALGFGMISAQPPQLSSDEKTLREANLSSDSDSLLQFFRDRTLDKKDLEEIKSLIGSLGSPSYRERERAMAKLILRGPGALTLLREALRNSDLEVARRAEKCIQNIQEKNVAVDVPMAAARLLAARRHPEALPTLLAYFPFADQEIVSEEIGQALSRLATRAPRPGPADVVALADQMPLVLAAQSWLATQPDPTLVAAVGDKSPRKNAVLRRAAAGEALLRAGVHEQWPAVKNLLADPDLHVRLRIALALVQAGEKQAVPVLIDLLPKLTLQQAWQAEDVLFRLAQDKNPPAVSLSNNESARTKCRDAWQAWWKEHAQGIDLAMLKNIPPLKGYTLIVLLDLGQVIELGNNNQMRWQVNNLLFPLDAQYLGNDRLLVAEYHGGRVTERNVKTGAITWQHRVGGPMVAQRLPNGNTFITADTQFIEVDREGNEILKIQSPNGDRVMKAMKLPNGEIVCLTSEANVVRMDTSGKVLHSFSVNLGLKLFGGRIHMLPNGRVLIPHNAENKVVEYDAQGKVVWEVAIDQPIIATRLPNGHTLVTSMLPTIGAVEFDRAGREIWSYKDSSSTRVTRAIRR